MDTLENFLEKYLKHMENKDYVFDSDSDESGAEEDRTELPSFLNDTPPRLPDLVMPSERVNLTKDDIKEEYNSPPSTPLNKSISVMEWESPSGSKRAAYSCENEWCDYTTEDRKHAATHGNTCQEQYDKGNVFNMETQRYKALIKEMVCSNEWCSHKMTDKPSKMKKHEEKCKQMWKENKVYNAASKRFCNKTNQRALMPKKKEATENRVNQEVIEVSSTEQAVLTRVEGTNHPLMTPEVLPGPSKSSSKSSTDEENDMTIRNKKRKNNSDRYVSRPAKRALYRLVTRLFNWL